MCCVKTAIRKWAPVSLEGKGLVRWRRIPFMKESKHKPGTDLREIFGGKTGQGF